MGLQKLLGDIGAAGDSFFKAAGQIANDTAVKFDDLSQKPTEEIEAVLKETAGKALKAVHQGVVTGLETVTDAVRYPEAAAKKVGDILKGKPPGGPSAP